MIIILIIMIIYNNNKKESFDQRIDGTTKEQCGIICTKVLGCDAFSYDSKNKYCFLSKDGIYFRPQKKAYTNFYDRKFPRCNKLYKIDDPFYNPRNSIIRNATYECMKKEGGNVNHMIYDNKEREWKDDISTINKATINPYKFERIEWNGIVPISDGRFNTSLEVPVPTDPTQNDEGSIIATPDETDDNQRGARHINIPELTPDVSTISNGAIDLDRNLHLVTNPTESNSFNIMREYDDEFLGQYQFHHKCSTNISKQDCMTQCLEDDDCVGTEWNPVLFGKVQTPNVYEIEENICCPKRRINKVTSRKRDKRFGHFYLKENVNREYIQKDEILVGLNKDEKNNNINDLSEKYSKWKNNIY